MKIKGGGLLTTIIFVLILSTISIGVIKYNDFFKRNNLIFTEKATVEQLAKSAAQFAKANLSLTPAGSPNPHPYCSGYAECTNPQVDSLNRLGFVWRAGDLETIGYPVTSSLANPVAINLKEYLLFIPHKTKCATLTSGSVGKVMEFTDGTCNPNSTSSLLSLERVGAGSGNLKFGDQIKIKFNSTSEYLRADSGGNIYPHPSSLIDSSSMGHYVTGTPTIFKVSSSVYANDKTVEVKSGMAFNLKHGNYLVKLSDAALDCLDNSNCTTLDSKVSLSYAPQTSVSSDRDFMFYLQHKGASSFSAGQIDLANQPLEFWQRNGYPVPGSDTNGDGNYRAYIIVRERSNSDDSCQYTRTYEINALGYDYTNGSSAISTLLHKWVGSCNLVDSGLQAIGAWWDAYPAERPEGEESANHPASVNVGLKEHPSLSDDKAWVDLTGNCCCDTYCRWINSSTYSCLDNAGNETSPTTGDKFYRCNSSGKREGANIHNDTYFTIPAIYIEPTQCALNFYQDPNDGGLTDGRYVDYDASGCLSHYCGYTSTVTTGSDHRRWVCQNSYQHVYGKYRCRYRQSKRNYSQNNYTYYCKKNVSGVQSQFIANTTGTNSPWGSVFADTASNMLGADDNRASYNSSKSYGGEYYTNSYKRMLNPRAYKAYVSYRGSRNCYDGQGRCRRNKYYVCEDIFYTDLYFSSNYAYCRHGSNGGCNSGYGTWIHKGYHSGGGFNVGPYKKAWYNINYPQNPFDPNDDQDDGYICVKNEGDYVYPDSLYGYANGGPGIYPG